MGRDDAVGAESGVAGSEGDAVWGDDGAGRGDDMVGVFGLAVSASTGFAELVSPDTVAAVSGCFNSGAGVSTPVFSVNLDGVPPGASSTGATGELVSASRFVAGSETELFATGCGSAFVGATVNCACEETFDFSFFV